MQRRTFIHGLCACCGLAGVGDLLGATREVKKGDTLYSISRECEVSVAELMKANPGIDPARLRVGQVIHLPDTEPPPASGNAPTPPSGNATGPSPSGSSDGSKSPTPPPASEPPEFHTVVKGDTLSSIARRHGLSLAELRQLNPAASDILSIGQLLRVRKATQPLVDAGPAKEPSGGNRTTIVIPSEAQPGDEAPPPPKPPGPPPKSEDKDTGGDDPPAPKYVFVAGKAKALIDRPKLGSREWRYIVIHHSGTDTGNAKIFDYYHRRVRGMENGMAYHFVIGNGSESGDGEIETGERWLKQLQGGHVRSDAQNEVAIGICLVGDFQRRRPTRRQVSSLIELVTYLQGKVGRPKPQFFLHRDINIIPTTCPGRLFPDEALYRLFGRSPRPRR